MEIWSGWVQDASASPQLAGQAAGLPSGLSVALTCWPQAHPLSQTHSLASWPGVGLVRGCPWEQGPWQKGPRLAALSWGPGSPVSTPGAPSSISSYCSQPAVVTESPVGRAGQPLSHPVPPQCGGDGLSSRLPDQGVGSTGGGLAPAPPRLSGGGPERCRPSAKGRPPPELACAWRHCMPAVNCTHRSGSQVQLPGPLRGVPRARGSCPSTQVPRGPCQPRSPLS